MLAPQCRRAYEFIQLKSTGQNELNWSDPADQSQEPITINNWME